MKCCNRIYDLQGICLYFTSLIPLGWNLVCWDWECLLSSSKNPWSSNLFQAFLRNVFYRNSYLAMLYHRKWNTGACNSLKCLYWTWHEKCKPFLFVLFDQIFLGKWVRVCISVLIWVSTECQELLNSYNNFLFGFGYLHCFSFSF